MDMNKIVIISLIFIVGLACIGAISAQDSDDLALTDSIDDIDDGNIEASVDDADLIADDSSCCDDNAIIVMPDPENPNQVQKPTVQPAIDAANEGDTIILDGEFVHCHFMINKTLTIIATPGTSVGVCPHHTHQMRYGEGPEEHGVFYISPEANGTVISGFTFTNDFYNIATYVYNPFGVWSDADDVVLENLTFDWKGVPQESSNWNPDDFLFNAIILNNTDNTTIRNVVLGNVNSFINSVNASNVNTENITSVKVLETSDIAVGDVKILAGDGGNLQITLKGSNNLPLSNKNVTVIIDGVSKTLTTDGSGIAKMAVKYASSGTHYVTVSFAGDDDYKSAIKTSKIVVSKKATKLTAPKATLKVKKAKKIAIKLKYNGKAVSNKKITIKVKGKTFSAKTNSKGVAYVKVKVAKKGTFKYTAKFAGDGAYKAASKKGTVVVKK